MSENLIDLHISELKCDNPHCDYRDRDAKFENYPQYVNKPCPQCGQNLLTEADMKTCLRIHRVIGWINKTARFFGYRRKPTDVVIPYTMDMDGSGRVKNFREKDLP